MHLYRHILLFALLVVTGLTPAAAPALNATIGPLHRAAYINDTISLKKYLTDGLDVNQKASGGVTPLQVAAYEGRLESVKLLLEHGADPNLKDDKERTALDLAFARHHLDVAGVLIPVTGNAKAPGSGEKNDAH